MTLARRLLIAGVGAGYIATRPPTDASWVRSGSNPILSPAVAWEETAVYEPSVIYDGGWKMWYDGGWDHPAVGYATSSDGISWTKYASNPVYGQGGSGYANSAASTEVILVGSTLYMFTSGGPGIGPTGIRSTFRVATSPQASGIVWTTQSSSISLPSGASLWGNRTVWVEGATWYMLQEALTTFWAIYLYTSSDGLTWSIANSGTALTSLQVHAGGSYGGPYIWQRGTSYELWYHATPGTGALPTNIHHATSTDRINWTITSPSPVLTHVGSGFEVDQVADPSLIVRSGTAYLFYDGDDNVSEAAHIGVATAPALP